MTVTHSHELMMILVSLPVLPPLDASTITLLSSSEELLYQERGMNNMAEPKQNSKEKEPLEEMRLHRLEEMRLRRKEQMRLHRKEQMELFKSSQQIQKEMVENVCTMVTKVMNNVTNQQNKSMTSMFKGQNDLMAESQSKRPPFAFLLKSV